MVGSAAFRRCALSLLKACSIGLRSGEYLGRYRSFAPAASITSRTAATLWTGRLSIIVGSEEAPNEELASVRRTNRTYSFPVSGFHERAFAICSEGMSETRLTSLNSVRNRLVGYSLHAALRHRLVQCDHSRRIIQPSS